MVLLENNSNIILCAFYILFISNQIFFYNIIYVYNVNFVVKTFKNSVLIKLLEFRRYFLIYMYIDTFFMELLKLFLSN